MGMTWSFGQKVGIGFASIVILTCFSSGIAIYALRGVVASKDLVISQNAQNLTDVARLDTAMERRVATIRGFLLTREDLFIERIKEATAEFDGILSLLNAQAYTDDAKRLLEKIGQDANDFQTAADRVIALRKTDASIDAVGRAFAEQLLPKRDVLDEDVSSFTTHEKRQLQEAKKAATEAAESAIALVLGIAGASALLAIGIALFLTRSLSRQIGSTVQHMQSSSTELQSAASQQATGAKESATAMNEIATTMSELLATSQQIAESAQRVAHIASETAGAARAGDQTARKTSDSVGSIKQQVDLIVTHMLDLGKKSQQIGSILEIINELAEQTNILAINATIEAAGAGESGRRFAVVADEIRKLADRVGGSTKEIRTLIDEVRAAVNTTIMATESGSKATDAGAKQFAEVTSALKQITGLVGTSTEAAKEIELSTKQQATAVEQVKLAFSDVAQATRETEASSSQTLQTATQLSGLARELKRLIQPRESA